MLPQPIYINRMTEVHPDLDVAYVSNSITFPETQTGAAKVYMNCVANKPGNDAFHAAVFTVRPRSFPLTASFQAFRNSKKRMSVTEFEGHYGVDIDNGWCNSILVYENGLYIEDYTQKNDTTQRYNLLLDQSEWQGVGPWGLLQLELRLFVWQLMMVGQDPILSVERVIADAKAMTDKKAHCNFIIQMIKMLQAHDAVNEAWSKLPPSITAAEDYPFHVSFDEIDIASWIDTQVALLK
jgi:hypothetical protein